MYAVWPKNEEQKYASTGKFLGNHPDGNRTDTIPNYSPDTSPNSGTDTVPY